MNLRSEASNPTITGWLKIELFSMTKSEATFVQFYTCQIFLAESYAHGWFFPV